MRTDNPGVTERTRPVTAPPAGVRVDPEDLADVEPWQAVQDEAVLTIWRAESAPGGHGDVATLLAGLL